VQLLVRRRRRLLLLVLPNVAARVATAVHAVGGPQRDCGLRALTLRTDGTAIRAGNVAVVWLPHSCAPLVGERGLYLKDSRPPKRYLLHPNGALRVQVQSGNVRTRRDGHETTFCARSDQPRLAFLHGANRLN
jgi:hypothetical protein